MANPDASREAAHRRYEKAGQIAADAGSFTQAALNDAYKNLLQNADWMPDEDWASEYAGGVEAYMPKDTMPLISAPMLPVMNVSAFSPSYDYGNMSAIVGPEATGHGSGQDDTRSLAPDFSRDVMRDIDKTTMEEGQSYFDKALDLDKVMSRLPAAIENQRNIEENYWDNANGLPDNLPSSDNVASIPEYGNDVYDGKADRIREMLDSISSRLPSASESYASVDNDAMRGSVGNADDLSKFVAGLSASRSDAGRYLDELAAAQGQEYLNNGSDMLKSISDTVSNMSDDWRKYELDQGRDFSNVDDIMKRASEVPDVSSSDMETGQAYLDSFEDLSNSFNDTVSKMGDASADFGKTQSAPVESDLPEFMKSLDDAVKDFRSVDGNQGQEYMGNMADILSRYPDAARDFSSTEGSRGQELTDDFNNVGEYLSGVMDRYGDIVSSQDKPYLEGDKREVVSPEQLEMMTSDEVRSQWNDYYNSHGGLREGYDVGSNDLARSLSDSVLFSSSLDAGNVPDKRIDPYGNFAKGIDKVANENFDDGTMRSDMVKSKNMSGAEYKRQREFGIPGRPIDEIDDNAVYDKLDEMNNYGYTPYIEDAGQLSAWMSQELADDTTAAFNEFGQARDLITDAKINYDGMRLSRETFIDEVQDYLQSISDMNGNGEMEIVSADDPSVDPDSDLPMTVWWSFPGTDIAIPADGDLQYAMSEDTGKLYVWIPGHEDQAVEYDGIEDYDAHRPEWGTYRSEEGDPVHRYMKTPRFEYSDPELGKVSLSYDETEELARSISEGTADIDYGPFNIAKDSSDRKGWADMFGSGDFSDFVPNMVDLSLGSAPLFHPFSAWTMAAANAGTASQGLDPRLYDTRDNSRRRVADDMTGEKYLSNTVLSGLVPVTENVAGIIGGSGGALGKPIQALLKKIGAPAIARTAVDVAGEGVEEDVASLWEDYQTNGLEGWYADPLYKTDDYGNVITAYNPVTGEYEPRVLYDSSGHEVRDPNTPVEKRVQNWKDQLLDNFLAGSTLGAAFAGPKTLSDVATGSGYYGESRERRLLRKLEKANNLPKFREAKRGDASVRIGPEDIGTYGKRE